MPCHVTVAAAASAPPCPHAARTARRRCARGADYSDGTSALAPARGADNASVASVVSAPRPPHAARTAWTAQTAHPRSNPRGRVRRVCTAPARGTDDTSVESAPCPQRRERRVRVRARVARKARPSCVTRTARPSHRHCERGRAVRAVPGAASTRQTCCQRRALARCRRDGHARARTSADASSAPSNPRALGRGADAPSYLFQRAPCAP